MYRFGICIAVFTTFRLLITPVMAADHSQPGNNKNNPLIERSADTQDSKTSVQYGSYNRLSSRKYAPYHGHHRMYRGLGLNRRYYTRAYFDFRPYNRYVVPSNLYRPYAHAPYFPYLYGF